MIAIDTNLVIRYLIGDHAQQTDRARAIIDGEMVFMPIAVTLEVEWVLRSIYRLPRLDCLTSIRDFAGLPTVIVDEAPIVAEALELSAGGMDFADALHLLKAQHCSSFATFDEKLVHYARDAGFAQVREA
nr:PIN domain-containing protein [Rhizobium sp. Q54]